MELYSTQNIIPLDVINTLIFNKMEEPLDLDVYEHRCLQQLNILEGILLNMRSTK
jgi:hypothetical protein